MFGYKINGLLLILKLILVAQSGIALDDKVDEGTVVSVADGKLVLKDKDNVEHTYSIAAGTKVMLDGKDAQLTDLQQGDSAKLGKDSSGKVTSVTARRGTVKTGTG